ncbi:unnamed protein product [Schistocephalus solidus]|uniref:Reverse transcriptase domain-containing protein n=1 Tax=Schistocephalus solidus TaxID=70667 RepID=A0A183SJ24_SCHSO|nr:unnamed protein product [Schistocephalus solidus]
MCKTLKLNHGPALLSVVIWDMIYEDRQGIENPKLFYDDLRQNTRNKDPIPLLRTAEGIDRTEDGAKADRLSEFFQSVFTKEMSYDYPTNGFEVDKIVETVHFTETTVLKELLGLMESKSLGPDEVEVESGVPQGSVLCPIVFIVYINDCANELDCDISMFADDLKLWRVIQTTADEENLQCNIIRVGKSNPSNRTVYSLNGIPLKEVDAQNNLGVWITPSLKPSIHCAKIAKSAMSILYRVKRAFAAFTTDCFAKVFETFVWPQLESTIQVWRLCAAKDINILEKVERQLRGDLILTFCILRVHDCCLVPGDFFE